MKLRPFQYIISILLEKSSSTLKILFYLCIVESYLNAIHSRTLQMARLPSHYLKIG